MSDDECQACGQPHTSTQHKGRPSCAGHVYYDRATYTPGQPRKRLDQPRPCRLARPKHADEAWRCRRHGGHNARNKARQERVISEAKAEAMAARWAVPVETTPTDAILGRVAAFAGHVKFYAHKIEELDDADLVWGVTKQTDGHVVVGNGPQAHLDATTDEVSEAKPNVWLVLYNEASEKLVRFAAEALKAGIEERRVRLAEQQGQMVADVIRAVLGDLDLTPEQTAKAAEAAPRHLRLLAG